MESARRANQGKGGAKAMDRHRPLRKIDRPAPNALQPRPTPTGAQGTFDSPPATLGDDFPRLGRSAVNPGAPQAVESLSAHNGMWPAILQEGIVNVSSVSTSASLKELLALLGTTTTTGTTDTDAESLIASVSGTDSDSLEISSAAQSLSSSQDDNPLKADMEKLSSLIESGDLDGAKELYATMKERMQAHQGDGTDGKDPMASDFEAIGDALESGDADTALSTLETLQSKLEKFGAGPKPEDASNDTSTTSTAADLNTLLVAAYTQQAQALAQASATSAS